MERMTSQKRKLDPVESIDNAAEAMSRAKRLLSTASVEDCNYCETELALAIESLDNLRLSLETAAVPPAVGLQGATRQIQRDVSEFAELLRQAREFNAGCSSLAESSAAGYNASGVPAQVERDPSRIALKG